MNSQHIYYLDDDTDDLLFFKEEAENLGHRVSIFVNGKVMLQAMAKKGQLPDIIFLDILMPVINGEEILHAIKNSNEWNSIPVVMISGGYAKKMVYDYLQAGANYVIKKPFNGDWRSVLEQVLVIDWKNFQAYA
jgi:CheY-like chemotaxis protein